MCAFVRISGNQSDALCFSSRVRRPSRRGVWPNLRRARRPAHARSALAFFRFPVVIHRFMVFARSRKLAATIHFVAALPFLGEWRADSLAQIPARRGDSSSAHRLAGHSRSVTLRNPASECSASRGPSRETWKRSLVPRATVVFPTAGCESVWASVAWQEWRWRRGGSATGKTRAARARIFHAACSSASAAKYAPGASRPHRCIRRERARILETGQRSRTSLDERELRLRRAGKKSWHWVG